MMKRIYTGFCAFALATALILGFAAPAQAEKAPDFTATAATGETVKLSDYAGKTVVLEWVNYGCPYVQKHYKSNNMQKLQGKYTAEGVIWLSINSSASGKQGHYEGEELLEQIAAHSAQGTHYINDTDGTIGKAYGAKTTPHMVVIDPKGDIVYRGAIDSIESTDTADIEKAENFVVSALDALAAGEPVAIAETKGYGCGVKYAD